MPLRKLALFAVAPALLALLIGLVSGNPALWQPAAVAAAVLLALGLGSSPSLKSYQYTAWIIAAVVAAMIYPAQLLHWGDFDLRNKWLTLIAVQMVMFGMGTQMSLKDFAGVAKMPYGVLIAVASQFIVMPLVGFALTKIFTLPDEVAAGVILIGACSSGLASNVMCYIAKANLALSITATAVTTLIAPFMTPMWMNLLAGRLVEVDFTKMMMEIVKIVIVPIGAALLGDHLRNAPPATRRAWLISAILSAVLCVWLFSSASSLARPDLAKTVHLSLESLAFIAAAIVVGVLYAALVRAFPSLPGRMPLFSMAGIVYFTTITTAAGRDNLLLVGGLLFVVAVLHNTFGYVLGYSLAWLARLDRASRRTVAIEVGLQNGGMASGLAASMGKLATVGLAAAVFSPWMNISGSLLANFWRRRPVSPDAKSPGV
ncbi:bile acid:sodium symporter [Nibricoccus aquaticus]|uniref:Bile acid:sodium symporter n=1 Tax=Nibricoccus aquaticus TaxID=2576891 RepID=A0A290QG87_9BACT|nr:bile acid:sodium symporter family protein [Nibricoccus aquaticus]ATC63351.1 bile acid:sodium symporter [Nibricoccus aquaticus]